MKRYTPAQNVATQKYLAAKMEQVRFWVWKGEKDKIKAKAEARGMNLTQYMIHAVNTLEGEQAIKTSRE